MVTFMDMLCTLYNCIPTDTIHDLDLAVHMLHETFVKLTLRRTEGFVMRKMDCNVLFIDMPSISKQKRCQCTEIHETNRCVKNLLNFIFSVYIYS